MNIVQSSVKIFLARVGGALISFLGLAYFAHLLSPSELGVFFLFQALLSITTIPADFGIRGAVEKRISEGQDAGQILSTAVLLKIIPFTMVVALLILFRGVVINYLHEDLIGLLIITLFFRLSYDLIMKVINAELRVGETALVRLSVKVIWFGVGTVLLWFGFGSHALIYGLVAGYVVAFLWGIAKQATPFGSPSREHARSLYEYAKFNFISSVSGSGYGWIDTLFIGYLLTQADVSAYEIAWRITNIPMIFSYAIAKSIFPQMSEWDANDAKDSIENLIANALLSPLLLAVPAFFGIILFSREILHYIFGAEYTTAWLILIILMGEKTIRVAHAVLGRSLWGVNRPDLAARSNTVGFLLNALLNPLLIWQYGLFGAAVATTVSSITTVAIHILYLNRILTIRFYWRGVGWCVIASSFMAIILLIIRWIIEVQSVFSLIGAILTGVVVYLGFILLFTPLRTKMMDVVWTLIE